MAQQATLSLTLAGGSEVPGDRGLAIDLSRVDIETALDSGDEPVELLLDLEAREVDGGATRRHTLAVGCTLADLERMLEDSGDSVRVRFDAEALEQAIRDTDFEAHGLREKMAVLAVVVATTGAAAGGAQAMPAEGHSPAGGSGGAAVVSARDMANSTSGSVQSTDGAPATRANPSEAAAAGAASPPRLAENARLESRHGGGLPTRANPSEAAAAAAAGEARLAEQARLDSYREVLPTRAHPSNDSSSVDAPTFVVVGGIALALLGAAFGAAAATRNTPKPT